MRTQVVKIGSKTVTVREFKVKELREKIFPMLIPFFDRLLSLNSVTEVVTVIPEFNEKLSKLVPEVTAEELDEAFPSEIEELVKAIVQVNFQGIMQLLGRVLSSIPIPTSQR